MFKQRTNDKQVVLHRITLGDEAAFKNLYESYWQDIYSLALAYLRSPAGAEDILQEVFIKLWLQKEKLREVGQFEAWLFILTRNELITALRQKALQAKRLARYAGDSGRNIFSPANDLNADDLEKLVEQSLQSLTSKQQKIYLLSRQEGKTLEEIAESLGLSKKTVSNTLTLVLNHIRTYLRRHHALYIAGLTCFCLLCLG